MAREPDHRREMTGRVTVGRRGEATVVDDRGRLLFSLDPDHLLAAGAVHGDLVLVRRARGSRRRTTGPAADIRAGGPRRTAAPALPLPPLGEVVRVLERGSSTVVGTLVREAGEDWVVPDDRRLPRVRVQGGSLGASPGEKVVAGLARYPGLGRPWAAGPVVERLGVAGEAATETLAVIRRLGLRDAFPPEVLAEAEALPGEVRPNDLSGRLDLTGEIVFTIDDADARDLDDAVSLAPPERGRWRLGVHIADVSHYVAPGSALDREAALRGTSVYLVDRVLPMFPPRLSNGIASLHPGPLRLTVTVFMDIDEHGRVVGHDIRRSVIRSAARLTYDEALGLIEGSTGSEDHGLATRSGTRLGPTLREMSRLAERLAARRRARGALDFDLAEEKVVLDEEGRPVEVVRRPRDVATRLIEEFMIAANETVADHLLHMGRPFVARIHETPSPDDLQGLRELLAPLGYRVPARRPPRPSELQAVLEAARGRPEHETVHRAVLRALPQARYSAVRAPHYGLASPNYTHFTSPIRRYPDLTVHRSLLGPPSTEPGLDAARLSAAAEWSSRQERLAEQAESEHLDLMKVELARRLLGEVHRGEVTQVHGFGAFVRLETGFEGLVPAGLAAPDREGVRALRPGQEVRVQVVRADLERRHVELALVHPLGPGLR